MRGTTEIDRLAAFFDDSPDAILVVGPDGEIRRANERVVDLFGYQPSELVGESVEVLVPEAYREEHPRLRNEYFEDVERRPMGAGLALEARRKDGSTFPVDVSLSPIEQDGEPEVIAAVRDTTERHRARQKYQTLLETAPDAAFVVDASSGEILEVNRAATELLGLPEDSLIGSVQTALHPSDSADRYRDLFETHVERERVTASRFENGDDIYVETAAGERVPVEVSAKRIDLQGRDVLVAMFRDVSERRENERQLNRQIDRLERLAGVLSHDLRNPLNVAEGNVDLARKTEDLDRLEEVERAHDRMREILEDVLTMVRGGSKVESVDTLEFSTVVKDCWANVATADAALTVATDGIVYADGQRLGHLFENLFRNSVEHAGDDAAVTVGLLEDGFFVADDGPGIPAEAQESVFESGWTTNESGTGLGLSIVADIAAAHDWDADVSDSEDGGARFEFTNVRTAPYDDSFAADEG
jgi:PAS domain S-box-containing protein